MRNMRKGWIETKEWCLIPPGWVFVGTGPGTDGAEGEASEGDGADG